MMYNMSSQRFIVLGDPQVGNVVQEERTIAKMTRILREIREDDVVLVPGDLTDKGVVKGDSFFHRYLVFCACAREEGHVPPRDQLRTFHDTVVAPLSERCKNVLVCVGNHDEYTQTWWGHQYPAAYVKDRHGGPVYAKTCNGVHVLCLSKYPTRANTEWMDAKLAATRSPFCVFFHFNTQGPYSDWWSPEDKERFLGTLRKYGDRCAFVAEGHVHHSYADHVWHGFRTINGSGEEAVVVDVPVITTRSSSGRGKRVLGDVEARLL